MQLRSLSNIVPLTRLKSTNWWFEASTCPSSRTDWWTPRGQENIRLRHSTANASIRGARGLTEGLFHVANFSCLPVQCISSEILVCFSLEYMKSVNPRTKAADDASSITTCVFVPFYDSALASSMLSEKTWMEILSHNKENLQKEEKGGGYDHIRKHFEKFGSVVKPCGDDTETAHGDR